MFLGEWGDGGGGSKRVDIYLKDLRFEICRLSVAMRVDVGGMRMTRFVFQEVEKEDCIESIIEILFL